MFTNFVGGASVNKPSPKGSLEEQTLTFEGLQEKKNLWYLKFGRGFNGDIVQIEHKLVPNQSFLM
jgi:hypothetical protein